MNLEEEENVIPGGCAAPVLISNSCPGRGRGEREREREKNKRKLYNRANMATLPPANFFLRKQSGRHRKTT